MKVYIIKACINKSNKRSTNSINSPSQSIFSLAACTPSDINIEMTDETINMKVNYKTTAEIVVIIFSTPDAIRAYELAEDFKSIGKIVVLGGFHVKFNQEEALDHCDSILVGEYENTWSRLLIDHRWGSRSRIYEAIERVNLSDLNPFPTDIIPISNYNHIWSVVVSRGSNNTINHNIINSFFGATRYRPVDNIIEEIKNSKAKFIELISDNIASNREYASELFTKLKSLNIKWYSKSKINIADDHELLKLACESGLSYLSVKIDTPVTYSLDNTINQIENTMKLKNQIKKIHSYGIILDSKIQFGFDEHNKDIFNESVNYVRTIDLDIAHGHITVPLPGSNLYYRLISEGRLLTKDWSKYDGKHLVYQHKHLNQKTVTQGMEYFEKETKSISTFMKYLNFMIEMTFTAFKK